MEYQSYLQTKNWAEFKEKQGWKAHFIDSFLILEKQLHLGKTILYCPEPSKGILKKETIEQIDQLAKKTKTIFCKIELLEERDQALEKKLQSYGFQKSFEDVQPSLRQWINLIPDLEEIKKQMKSKGRYNIKVAVKHKVEVRSGDEHESEEFNHLMQETAKREKFTQRSKQYFEDLLSLPETTLLMAYYQNQPIAGIILAVYQDFGIYLYGASSARYRNVMAPYLLHFEAIRLSKEKGAKIYDLLAIGPPNAPNHKWAGLREFKQKFGGREVELMGAYDKVYQPFWYWIYKVFEKRRRQL